VSESAPTKSRFSPPRLPPRNIWQRLAPLVFDAGDGADLRLRKSAMLLTAILTNTAVGVWFVWFLFQGVALPWSMVLGFPVASGLLLIWYIRTRRFVPYGVIQLGLFLLMPMVVQGAMGGYLQSSGFVLLSMLAPLGALLTFGRQASLAWFGVYLTLLVVSTAWHHDREMEAAQALMMPAANIALVGVFISAILSTVAFFLLRYLVLQRERFQAELASQHSLLAAEREKSEALLGNLLPRSIARRLRDDPSLIADSKPDVTVMFADIVNFTRLADELKVEPRRLVDVLNHVFRRMDHLCENYGLEKIKTVGDAYMVVGGLDGRDDAYTDAMADMAVDLQEIFAHDPVAAALGIRFHVGIATGPAIAGVIGSTRFSYDVWGDTVNIASRLTAESAPGTVFVDRATHDRLSGRFEFGPAREMTVKGKDRLQVFQLLGRVSAGDSPSTASQSASAAERSVRSAPAGTRA
jgi:adenylate cyclase